MSAHTPGPWHVPHFAVDSHSCECRSVVSEVHAGGICEIEVHNGLRISDGGNDAPPMEEAKANARLIAAAPDLLAMLKVAQLWLDVDGRYDMQGINAAIAKAEGAS